MQEEKREPELGPHANESESERVTIALDMTKADFATIINEEVTRAYYRGHRQCLYDLILLAWIAFLVFGIVSRYGMKE